MVTVQEIRNLLDNVPAASVPDATIEGNITRSTNFVNSVKDSSAPVEMVEDAIRAMAVWLTYGSYSEGISEQVGAVATALKVKMDHYRQVAELFINNISSEYVELDVDKINAEEIPLVGDDPAVYTMTRSEAWP